MSEDHDPWAELRRHTPARIALGRSGSSQCTADWLRFVADHAQARDAVHLPLDEAALRAGLIEDGWPEPLLVRSRAGNTPERAPSICAGPIWAAGSTRPMPPRCIQGSTRRSTWPWCWAMVCRRRRCKPMPARCCGRCARPWRSG